MLRTPLRCWRPWIRTWGRNAFDVPQGLQVSSQLLILHHSMIHPCIIPILESGALKGSSPFQVVYQVCGKIRRWSLPGRVPWSLVEAETRFLIGSARLPTSKDDMKHPTFEELALMDSWWGLEWGVKGNTVSISLRRPQGVGPISPFLDISSSHRLVACWCSTPAIRLSLFSLLGPLRLRILWSPSISIVACLRQVLRATGLT